MSSSLRTFNAREVERLFFVGLVVFWLLFFSVRWFFQSRPLDLELAGVSLFGMLLGSLFSLINFRSWRLLLLGLLGANLIEDERRRSRVSNLIQALLLKSVAILLCLLLLLRGGSSDLLGFLLSFTAYLLIGLLLLGVLSITLGFRQRKPQRI